MACARALLSWTCVPGVTCRPVAFMATCIFLPSRGSFPHQGLVLTATRPPHPESKRAHLSSFGCFLLVCIFLLLVLLGPLTLLPGPRDRPQPRRLGNVAPGATARLEYDVGLGAKGVGDIAGQDVVANEELGFDGVKVAVLVVDLDRGGPSEEVGYCSPGRVASTIPRGSPPSWSCLLASC